MEGITSILRGELQAGFAQQHGQLSKEIREEIGDAMSKVNSRVEEVEKNVSCQLQKTVMNIQGLSALG